jgi:hypothetical protein
MRRKIKIRDNFEQVGNSLPMTVISSLMTRRLLTMPIMCKKSFLRVKASLRRERRGKKGKNKRWRGAMMRRKKSTRRKKRRRRSEAWGRHDPDSKWCSNNASSIHITSYSSSKTVDLHQFRPKTTVIDFLLSNGQFLSATRGILIQSLPIYFLAFPFNLSSAFLKLLF